jgi:hypothetical protein
LMRQMILGLRYGTTKMEVDLLVYECLYTLLVIKIEKKLKNMSKCNKWN